MFAWRTLVRMADTSASDAARSLIAQRWGNRVALRAAETVIARADELPADVRAEVLAACDDRDQADGEGG